MTLLITGDGLGEKLPLTKSHMLAPVPPFRPKVFWEDTDVPRRLCSVLLGGGGGWLCWGTMPDRRDWEKDWDRELRGDADSEDEECREDERARDPGIFTGAEPPNSL